MKKGITPVISYVMLIAIVVVTTSAAYFWAYPHVERLGDGPKNINLVNQMESFDYELRRILNSEVGARNTFPLHLPEGNIRLDEENNKIVLSFRQDVATVGHISPPEEIGKPRLTWETQGDWENYTEKQNISIRDGEVSLEREFDEFIVESEEEWKNGTFNYTEVENETLTLLSEEAVHHNDSIPPSEGEPDEWETFYNETRSVRFLEEITLGYRYKLIGSGGPFYRDAEVRVIVDGKQIHEDESDEEEDWETWSDQINVSEREEVEIIFQYYSEKREEGHEARVEIDWMNHTFMNISDSGTYNSEVFETDLDIEPRIGLLEWEGELPEETEIQYRVRGREDENDEWWESVWVNATSPGETISGSEFVDEEGNRVEGYEWEFETKLVNGDYPEIDEVKLEVDTGIQSPGHLELDSRTMASSQPNLVDLDYELNDEDIIVNITGSPGTEREENNTQELDGEEEYNLTWEREHEQYQLDIKLDSEEQGNTPVLKSMTLEVENPDEVEQILETCTEETTYIRNEREELLNRKIGKHSRVYTGAAGAPGTAQVTLCYPNANLTWEGNCIKGRSGPRVTVVLEKKEITEEGEPVISVDFC